MKHLESLGVDTSNASMCWEYLPTADAIMNGTFDDVDGPYLLANTGFKHDFPAFTLQDIMEILPTEIIITGIKYSLVLHYGKKMWVMKYMDSCGFTHKSLCSNDIMDVAYRTLVWCLEKKFLIIRKENKK